MDVFSFSAIMRIMEQSPNHFTEPMSRVKRIDGMKYHFDQLTDEELAGIRGHLVVNTWELSKTYQPLRARLTQGVMNRSHLRDRLMKYRLLAHLLTFVAGLFTMYIFLWLQAGYKFVEIFSR
jgi:hypothetical protein